MRDALRSRRERVRPRRTERRIEVDAKGTEKMPLPQSAPTSGAIPFPGAHGRPRFNQTFATVLALLDG